MEGEAAALSCSAFDLTILSLSLNTYAAPIPLNMGFDGKKTSLFKLTEREMKVPRYSPILTTGMFPIEPL